MLIRAGYDIRFEADVPTPLMAMLSLHPSRNRDLVKPHRIVASPDVPIYDYLDAFGNVCTRMTVPAGGL
ncbi:MAG: transglutaminase family protein, partial [Sphingomonas sp.]